MQSILAKIMPIQMRYFESRYIGVARIVNGTGKGRKAKMFIDNPFISGVLTTDKPLVVNTYDSVVLNNHDWAKLG